MANFKAELKAFDYYYNTMMQGLNHLRVEPMFISAGLVDGGVAEGGAAVFLPNKMVKMPQLLAHVRSSIEMHGPSSFNKLVSTLRRISDYVKLANGLESKRAELKRHYSGDNTSTTPNSTAALSVDSKMEDTGGVVRLGMPYDQRPELKELNRFLADYCKHWRATGLQLGLQSCVLDQMEADYHALSERFRVTLEKWLQLNVEATWANLELAITNANRESLGLQPLSAEHQGKATGKQRSQESDKDNDEHQGKVTGEQQSKESDEDNHGDAQVEGKKSKQSMYPTINRINPPCAIIINNKSFVSKPELKLADRSWSQSDVDKILTLEKEFGIRFNVYQNLGAQQMKGVLSSAVGPHSTYSALLLFIMTHGSFGDMLYGSDGELISLKELTAIFEATNCPALKNKPKILILHYCRGQAEEPAHREGCGDATGARIKDTIPQKADFLFVHSTTDGYIAYGHEKKGFITKLVDILIQNLNENHLQDVLLTVNREVAEMEYLLDGQYYKQMPSVVSQMRDKVWFDKD